MQTSKIHIALSFDDNFWAPAYATMRSVCLSSRRRADIVFHLCHDGLTEQHHADLKRITGEFGATLNFVDLRQNAAFGALAAELPSHRMWPPVVYARLFFDTLIPGQVERLIYLDCDMLVRSPIEELAELDLGGRTLAAVPEPHAQLIKHRPDMTRNRDIFDPAEPYFNSGLLVIDLARFAAADIPGRIATMRERGIIGRLYYDQDMLNLIFEGDWLALDSLWNLIDPRPAHQGLNPRVLHYTSKRKPWNLASGVAFARTYRHVMTNELFYRYWRYRMKRRFRRLMKLK